MIETLQSLRFVFALTVMLAHFSYAGIEGHSTGVGPMFFMLMTGIVMSRSYGPKILDGTFCFKHFGDIAQPFSCAELDTCSGLLFLMQCGFLVSV